MPRVQRREVTEMRPPAQGSGRRPLTVSSRASSAAGRTSLRRSRLCAGPPTDQCGGHPDVDGRGKAALPAKKPEFLPVVRDIQDPGHRDGGLRRGCGSRLFKGDGSGTGNVHGGGADMGIVVMMSSRDLPTGAVVGGDPAAKGGEITPRRRAEGPRPERESGAASEPHRSRIAELRVWNCRCWIAGREGRARKRCASNPHT